MTRTHFDPLINFFDLTRSFFHLWFKWITLILKIWPFHREQRRWADVGIVVRDLFVICSYVIRRLICCLVCKQFAASSLDRITDSLGYSAHCTIAQCSKTIWEDWRMRPKGEDWIGIQGCKMLEMSCEDHDRLAFKSQFVSHTCRHKGVWQATHVTV